MVWEQVERPKAGQRDPRRMTARHSETFQTEMFPTVFFDSVPLTSFVSSGSSGVADGPFFSFFFSFFFFFRYIYIFDFWFILCFVSFFPTEGLPLLLSLF